MIKQGAASPDGGLWWKYVTTANANANGSNVKVVIHAWDLPGHETVKQAE